MRIEELKFGIEIETVNLSRERTAKVIQEVVGGRVSDTNVIAADGRIWKAMRDGSLPGIHAEVVSPILTYNDIPQLQNVIRALRQAGARPHSSAGIHIHVDAAAFNTKQLTNLSKIIYKQEEILIRALGISQSRLNRYTRRTDSRFINEINRQKPQTRRQLAQIWYDSTNINRGHYDQSRYRILNLHSVFNGQTVEIRAFESTLHAGKVKAYIQLVLALAVKAINARSASSQQREFKPASAKYDLRVFLLNLGMIGDEFKTARLHLLRNMPGDAAFKSAAQRRAHNRRSAA